MSKIERMNIWQRLARVGATDFPNEIKHFWLAGDDYEMRYQKHIGNKNARRKYLMPYWVNGGAKAYHKGDVVPMITKNSRRAFYEVVGVDVPSWVSDRAGFDDGRKYDLKLHHIEKIEKGTRFNAKEKTNV